MTNLLPPIILLDGGLGTTLTQPPYSFEFNHTKPLWSSHLLLSPSTLSTLLAAQTAFASAGAEVILTDTYQASFTGFSLSGITDEKEASALMRGAVKTSREAFGGKEGKVALSLGPYGATMIPGQEYTGKYDEEHQSVMSLAGFHMKRLRAFYPFRETGTEGTTAEKEERKECWRNVDMVAFETIPRLNEIEAVKDVIRYPFMKSVAEGGSKMEYWITCVFPGEGNLLPDGSSVREVVKVMLGGEENGPLPMGIGFNCTKITKVEALINEFEEAVKEMVESKETSGWPSLVIYPDGTNGEVYNTSTKTWEQKEKGSELSWDETLFDIVSRARERRLWKSIFVGGCCKTTPVEIGKLRRRIDGERVD